MTGRWPVRLLALVGLASCAGVYTRIPLPPVSSREERQVRTQAGSLSITQAENLLRRNFYAILYDESETSTGETREAFIARLSSSETLAPTQLLSVTPEQLVAVGKQLGPTTSYELATAVERVQAPLRRRLDRVGRRVAVAAGRPDVVFILDPSVGLNAGAVAGFDSRQIAVGPPLILLAESEDGLAAGLGHEVAHITHRHTRTLAIQNLVVSTLQVVSMIAVASANAANCQRGYGCMSTAQLERSMAAAATATGLVANGTIAATGFSRDEEREADYYGLQYASRAGYRPEAAVVFLQRLLAWDQGGGYTFEIPFLRTHPATAERVVRVEKWAQALNGSEVAQQEATNSSETQAGAAVAPVEQTASVPVRAAASQTGTAVCWQAAAADNGRCSTCCSPGGCQTSCETGGGPAEPSGRVRPKTCWNADAHLGAARAVCTTCCTASVTCATTCAKVASE